MEGNTAGGKFSGILSLLSCPSTPCSLHARHKEGGKKKKKRDPGAAFDHAVVGKEVGFGVPLNAYNVAVDAAKKTREKERGEKKKKRRKEKRT